MINNIYTLGHSNHSTEKLLELLKYHNIHLVADVRRYPYSKYVNQFNRENFERDLDNNGYEYHFLGDIMGGKRSANDPLDLERGFDKIFGEIKAGKKITLLCAEKDPSRCHRAFLLSPHLMKKGLQVCHILADGSLIFHQDLEEKLLEEFCQEYRQISIIDRERAKLVQEAFKKRIKAKSRKVL